MHDFDPNAAAGEDSGIFGLPHTYEEAKIVLIPVPFDATTSYRKGASQGPSTILKASRQVDLYDLETGNPYEAGVHMLPISEEVLMWNQAATEAAEPIIAAGGNITEHKELSSQLETVNSYSKKVRDWVYQKTKQSLQQGKVVGIIGGDHSTPLGAIAAYAENYPSLGILHIDAHADLRKAYEGFTESHASIMYNVLTQVPKLKRLVQVGIRDLCEEEYLLIQSSHGKVILHDMPKLRKAGFQGQSWHTLCEQIVRDLPEHVYISFDIDGLDPSLCPHTGTPVPGGLSFYEVSYLISMVLESGRTIVGFDVNEVAPAQDPQNEWDGNVGARILYKLIGYTWLSIRNIAAKEDEVQHPFWR